MTNVSTTSVNETGNSVRATEYERPKFVESENKKINSSATVESTGLERTLVISGGGASKIITLRFDIDKERDARKNLVANGWKASVDSSVGSLG
jgi:hypothetical protein